MPSLMQEDSASSIGPPIRKNRMSVPSFLSERARISEPVNSAMVSSRYCPSSRAKSSRWRASSSPKGRVGETRQRRAWVGWVVMIPHPTRSPNSGVPEFGQVGNIRLGLRVDLPCRGGRSQRAAFAQLADLIGAHAEPFLQHLFGVLAQERRRSDRNRSEEHTSELQSRRDLVCRLLLEKK